MIKSILLTCCLFLFSFITFSQQIEECATGLIHEQLMLNDADYAAKFQANNALIKSLSKTIKRDKAGTILEIPVVVHIIHTGQAVGVGANISDAQVNSAITRMNDRYRNAHGPSVDTEIQFVLAKRDTNGNATTGIIRVNGSSVTNYSTEGITAGNGSGADEAAIKALSKWPNTDYYNIWVVTEIENNNGLFGIQGYAYFPGASSTVDGTVIMHTCFGTTGTVNSFNNQGRTLVHELGHGLNLHHTFNGDNDGNSCPTGAGDEVADTDPHIRASSNCPTGTNSCTGNSIDGVTSNFMNYSSQTCALEFTSGQSTRMRTAIMTTRPGLISSLGGTTPGAMASAAACTPSTTTPNNNFGFGILGVELNDMHVISGTTKADGGTGYKDRSNLQQANVDAGSTHTLTITTGTANNEDIAVYIDYNNDGDFLDANETVFIHNISSGSPVNNIHASSITIPSSGITTGTPIRMRVIGDWYNNSISGSCYNPTFGQIEDFAIEITSSSPALSVSVSNTNVSCNANADGSATANVSGGTAPYTYSWSFGVSSSATANNLAAGTYNVTVSDAASSTATASATITEPSLIMATLTSSAETCAGNDGSIATSSSGGTGNHTYTWTSGATTASISSLVAGTYTLTITDANGCTFSQSSVVSTTCTGPNLTINSNFCGATGHDPNYTLIYFGQDPSATDYRIRVNGPGVSNFVLTTGNTNRFNLNQITGIQYSQTYTVEVAGFISGSWSSYGPVCSMTTGSISNIDLMIHPHYCGSTGHDPTNKSIYYPTRSDALDYRFRVNGAGVSNFVLTIGSTLNRFNLNQIPGLQYGQAYTIEMAAFINGQWSNYGTACSITMGNISSIVNLMIHPVYCGSTGHDPTYKLIYYPTRADALDYRFRINGAGVSNFVLTIGSTLNRFNLNQIPGIQYGQTYTIEMAGFINGQWSNYGTACSITTGNISSIVNLRIHTFYCGSTNSDPAYRVIYYPTRSDALDYRFRVNGAGVSNFVLTIGSANNRFNLNQIPGMQYNQSYSIEMAGFINGQWSNYGTACNITTIAAAPPSPALTRIKSNNDNNNNLLSIYPNPSSKEQVYIQFERLDATDSDRIELEVYDIQGRRVIKKILSLNNGKVLTHINETGNLKAGVYMVNIIDGNQLTTKKLIVQ